MNHSENPIAAFTRKLKEHQITKDSPNRRMIRLMYLKLLLTLPYRLIERKKYKDVAIRYEPDKSPVFIIGHWRSGTTHVHNLLSKDPGFIFQNKYQNFFSDNFLTTEKFIKPVLAQMVNSFTAVKKWKVKASRTMDLDTPSESDTALISEISEFTYHWGHLFPKNCKEYFDKYLFLENIPDRELMRWKQTMKILFNKVYMKNKKGRLLIKNPGDTARIKHLLDMYPGARFIFLHRDPYDVFYSNLNLWNNVLNTISLQRISDKGKKEIVLSVYRKLHEYYFEQKELLKPNQLVEIRYDDIVESPLNSVQQIYEKLELKGLDKALPHFMSYIDANQHWEKNNYRRSGEDIAEINKRWDFAFDRWKYPKLDWKEHAAVVTG